jgi:hypothetical protein
MGRRRDGSERFRSPPGASGHSRGSLCSTKAWAPQARPVEHIRAQSSSLAIHPSEALFCASSSGRPLCSRSVVPQLKLTHPRRSTPCPRRSTPCRGWTARRAESEESVSPLGLWISAEEEIPCAKFRTHSRSAFVPFRNALSQVEDQMATPILQTVSPGALSVGEICDEVGTKEDSSPREGTGKHDECRFSPLAPCLALLLL